MTGRPESSAALGWGGQVADLIASFNSNAALSPSITLSGNNIFQAGNNTQPFGMSPYGGVVNFADTADYAPPGTSLAVQEIQSFGAYDPNVLTAFGSTSVATARGLATSVGHAITSVPPLTTVFPPKSGLALQLAQVAKVIAARGALGASRQIFFVQADGSFDTHSNQAKNQPPLLANLSASLSAFHSALVELGVQNNVTTFTMSEFGRTLTTNNGGTDHGWSSHHLMMGGGVKGGDIFGTMHDLVIGGPSDADGYGRIIPSTSTYQYAAGLGAWLGASPSQIATLFPNLANFPGGPYFMNA